MSQLKESDSLLRKEAMQDRFTGINSEQMEKLEEEILIGVRKLYPMLTEAESRQAAQNLRRYFEIVLEIQGKEMTAPSSKVDNPGIIPSIKERSNSLKS